MTGTASPNDPFILRHNDQALERLTRQADFWAEHTVIRSNLMRYKAVLFLVMCILLLSSGLTSQPARAWDLPLSGVATIFMGKAHTCALMTDNTLRCWGSNSSGQLGDGLGGPGAEDELEPTNVTGLGGDVINATAGQLSTCAVLDDFRVKCWGNYNRSADSAYFVNSTTPVQIGGLDGTNDVLDITAGEYHACVLLPGQPFNGVLCWGDNTFGELGNSAIPHANSDYYRPQPRLPVELPPMNPVKISAGRYHTCALADLGHVACWGSGPHGEIGNGQNTDQFVPVLVDGLSLAATDIAAGDYHTCALLNNTTVWCWGWNINGQLGDGTTDSSNVPVLAQTIFIKQISAGSHHTCALSGAGTVLCWGNNFYGQLGDGTRQQSLTPQLVPDLENVAQVFAGGYRTCALLLDTSVKCWGDGALTPQNVIANSIDFDETIEAPMDWSDVLGDVESDVPDPTVPPYDYGDAPDQVPATGQDVEAYPGVPGRFPTLDGEGAKGPKHANPRRYFLGDDTTVDAPVDADGLPNIITSTLTANLDVADDGWLNKRDITRFDDCKTVTLRVRVRRSPFALAPAPLYLNAWFDGNRDGDWKDVRPCETGGQSYEWMVQNRQIKNLPAPGAFVDVNVATVPVLSDSPVNPAWVRITLSDRPAIAPILPRGALPDGRGTLVDYFGYGETEDYRWDPVTDSEKYGDWEITKTATSNDPIIVGSTFTYAIEVSRTGGLVPNVAAALVDVLPPQTSFVSGVVFDELSPTVDPNSAVYEPSYGGPSGRVRWVGTLSDGGRFKVRFRARVNACPTAPITNTAYLILPGPGRIISATHEISLNCTPPAPPTITLDKQIVDAVGSTVPPAAPQISETVYLLTLMQANASSNLAAAIQDDLPLGLEASEVSAAHGVATITNGGRTVRWQGTIGPTLGPVQMWIRAGVAGLQACGRDLENAAQWAVRLPAGVVMQGASGPTMFTPACAPPAPEDDEPRPPTEPNQAPEQRVMLPLIVK